MAWLSRTLVIFRAHLEPSVPPGPAEGTEAQRWACVCPCASLWGWGHRSFTGLFPCPAPFPRLARRQEGVP